VADAGSPPDLYVPNCAFRTYHPEDVEQLEKFRCTRPGENYGIAAEVRIRTAHSEISGSGADAEIFVAVDDDEVIGALVVGPYVGKHAQLPELGPVELVGPSYVVHSLGVAVPRQDNHVGRALKAAVMAEFAGRHGVAIVVSEVEYENGRMNAVNLSLGVTAQSHPDPTEEGLQFTYVAVEPAP
jgi:hypothetical protein